MIYQRTILGSLAAFYCLLIGGLCLYQNKHARLNQLFAFYNLNNAIWNLNEYAVFFTNHAIGLRYYRLMGIGACFLIPSFIHFIHTYMGVGNTKFSKSIILISYF